MRRCLAEVTGQRTVALVGSFHAAALVDRRARRAGPGDRGRPGRPHWSRTPSGCSTPGPATRPGSATRSGSRRCSRRPANRRRCEAAAIDVVVRICGQVRAAGHPAGPAEAREAVRLAVDLARLRGLPAPGRGELVEALQSVLAHGEVLGRGRVVAAAMERVMVGDRRGRLAPGTPRSGLGPAVARPARRAEAARPRRGVPGGPARSAALGAGPAPRGGPATPRRLRHPLRRSRRLGGRRWTGRDHRALATALDPADRRDARRCRAAGRGPRPGGRGCAR